MKNTKPTPESIFDALSISIKLSKILNGFKLEEIHLFSYFTSILFLSDGNTLSDWTYRFITSPGGYPYSDILDITLKRLIQNGFITSEDDTEFYVSSDRGLAEFEKFHDFSELKGREGYLSTACNINLVIPYSKTIRALLKDPQLDQSMQTDEDEWLLHDHETYERFKQISNEVGVTYDNLLLSGVNWVEYFANLGTE